MGLRQLPIFSGRFVSVCLSACLKLSGSHLQLHRGLGVQVNSGSPTHETGMILLKGSFSRLMALARKVSGTKAVNLGYEVCVRGPRAFSSKQGLLSF